MADLAMGTPLMKTTTSSEGLLAGIVVAGCPAEVLAGIAGGGGASQAVSTGIEMGLGSVLAQPMNDKTRQIVVALFIMGFSDN